jgi:hypothetical protein
LVLAQDDEALPWWISTSCFQTSHQDRLQLVGSFSQELPLTSFYLADQERF